MAERSRLDRMQWDGDQLDEVVLSNVTFHIERMSHHGWWMAIDDRETGERIDFWWHASAEPVVEYGDWADVEQVNREPLAYPCDTRWTDRRGSEHQCESEKAGHVQHRCECGARKASK